MPYLADYIYYSSGTEVPEQYLIWGGLSILGHVLGKKCWIEHGEDYFKFSPNLFITLVGSAGAGKNTALNVNIRIMIKYFESMMLSASVQSREDIAMQMGQDTSNNPVTWLDPAINTVKDYRPFYILNEEINNFLSVDKTKMMQFMIQTYDGEQFSTGFKKDRIDNPTKKQWFRDPYMSLLAGAVPEWFMTNMKIDLFSSGMGRRMVIVYANRTKVIPFPKKPPGADAALERAIAHLQQASKFIGGARLSDKAKKWWEPFYIKCKTTVPTDPILAQFQPTKPMQVMKVALLLLRSETFDVHVIEPEHLEMANTLLTNLEPAIVKLTGGIGRNELAGIAQQLLEYLASVGGYAGDVEVRKRFYRHLNNPEFIDVINQLLATETLVISELKGRKIYFLPEQFKIFNETKILPVASPAKPQAPPSPS